MLSIVSISNIEIAVVVVVAVKEKDISAMCLIISGKLNKQKQEKKPAKRFGYTRLKDYEYGGSIIAANSITITAATSNGTYLSCMR